MEGWIAVVLAAGKGKRMHSSLPKVLHRLAGAPMLTHVLQTAGTLNPQETVVVCSPANSEAIQTILPASITIVRQDPPLGTGHALGCVVETLPFGDSHLLVLNGDVPLVQGETLQRLTKVHLERGATITVLAATMPAAEAADLGRVQRGARQKPIAIIEANEDLRSKQREVEINVGVYAIESVWLRAAITTLQPHANGEYYLTDLVAAAVADGRRVEILTIDDPQEALGVNSRAHLAQAEEWLQWKLRKRWMNLGVTLVDPRTTYLDGTVELQPDVILHPNTTVIEGTRMASGCEVGPNAWVAKSILGPSTKVGASTLHGVHTEADVHIGPYCHLRPDTYLGEGVYVGSHAEIKNSRIGPGTHVGHFSYIGDALIGARVNVGAGTVTCNYDGSAKHQTQIEDGAFIGSDSLLIAPVTIGAGAITGAGAVVTHNVAPGDKVLGVPARTARTDLRQRFPISSPDGEES